jgi:hypothetical protein
LWIIATFVVIIGAIHIFIIMTKPKTIPIHPSINVL